MIFAEQGLSDPAVSGCVMSAKVDLLIDVCCALLVNIRSTLMDAAISRPEDEDGEAGAFGRLLFLLQEYPEEDLAPAFELALVYRQRRMSSPLTGDHPQYDTDLTLDSGAAALRKRAAGLYQAWRPHRNVPASSQPENEGYVQTAAAAGAKVLRGYTHAFQASDTAAQLSKIQTNLTVKAMEGWSARRPSEAPANFTSEVTSPSSETGWLGRSRAALNAASESFRSVSESLASPASREAAPFTMEAAPRLSSPVPNGVYQEEVKSTSLGSPAAENDELSRPEPAKRTLSATELLRAKYIDNAPPRLPPRPPPLPKRNFDTPARSTRTTVGKTPPSPGVRRMASTSSREADRSDPGVERVPSSSSKAESIAISVSSYEAPTVAAGKFLNRKRETSLGSTLPTSTPPPVVPRSISAQSEEMQGVKEEDRADRGSTSSASPLFATPIGSDEHLPRLPVISQAAQSQQASSDAPTATVRTRVKTHGHNRLSSEQPRLSEKEALGARRATDSSAEPGVPPLSVKPRQKHVKAFSVAEALARYADDQTSLHSPSSKSSGRGALGSPISGSGEEILTSPVPASQLPDEKVRYTLTDGPNPTSTIVASPVVSPATSFRRTEVNTEGKHRVASRRVLSVSEGRENRAAEVRSGRVASLSGGRAPPPSSFRSPSPPVQGAAGLLKRSSRVHLRRASQSSEFQLGVETQVPPVAPARSPSYAQSGHPAPYIQGSNGLGATRGGSVPGASRPSLGEGRGLSWSSHPAGALYDDPYTANAVDAVQSPHDTTLASPPPPRTNALRTRAQTPASPPRHHTVDVGLAPSAAEMYAHEFGDDPELVSDVLHQQDVLRQLDAATLYD